MYPELVTRSDLEVFLPPIGGQTLYIFGAPRDLADPGVTLTARVHDECNGSDVFGSDICTCRPYLTHAIEECIQGAQQGGVGLVAYSRKEGRALGEVTKFLVYNARKRQPGGDQASTYFARTECVAGVQDARFQQLMPDVLHWLGVSRIDRLVSMSNLKHDALVAAGIVIGERVPLPPELVPPDAQVEIEAKKAAGYFTAEAVVDDLTCVVGRDLKDY
jgi:GTP cyclohydrolase II